MDSSILNSVTKQEFVVENSFPVFDQILSELEKLSDKSKNYITNRCKLDGRISSSLLNDNQYKTHGFAWFETYRISLRETYKWYKRLSEANTATRLDSLILAGAFAEYLSQMRDGIMMSQSEIIRYHDLGLDSSDFSFFDEKDVSDLITYGLDENLKIEIVDHLDKGQFPSLGLGDETLDMMKFYLTHTNGTSKML